jgi:hypothetical protein
MNLFGMHDYSPEWVRLLEEKNRSGYCVNTEAIGSDPHDISGKQYETHGGRIVHLTRLNNGYGSSGTIPSPQAYSDFARRCANFVATSTGCEHWIIGNEIALQWEWPNNEPITLSNYIKCYNLVYQAIHRVQPNAKVMPQPPAPWNPSTPDAPNWIDQFSRMLREIDGAEGLALHAYSHGHDPSLIVSDQTMDPPYDQCRYHFRCYRDFMNVIPSKYLGIPVYITESNPDGWQDVNNGWIQSAYLEIDKWNRDNPTRQIYCLAFYRWPDEDRDQFHIRSKPGVVEDFKAALAFDYAPIDVDSSQVTRLKALTVLNVRQTPGTQNKDGYDVISSLGEGEIVQLMPDSEVKLDGFTWRRILKFGSPSFQGWVAVRADSGILMSELLP